MAEAVALLASIATILDSCTKCLRLLRDIHGASKEQAKLRITISSINGVVQELQETTRHAQNAPNTTQLKTIPPLFEEGSPLACLRDTLSSIEHKLSESRSAKGIRKFSNKAGWPFKKEDIKTTLGVLKLHQKTLILAFQNDTFLVTQDIYKEVRIIQEHTKATNQESGIIREDVVKIAANLDILTTTSKDGFQHIKGQISASASKTSNDIEKISSLISSATQENKQNVDKLQASIKQSGLRYTIQDFENLDRYRKWHNASNDHENDMIGGEDIEDTRDHDGDDGSEERDGDSEESDDDSDDGDDDSDDGDGDDEDAIKAEVSGSDEYDYGCNDTRYDEDEQGTDSEYSSDMSYETT
jgi:hypothetical protein